MHRSHIHTADDGRGYRHVYLNGRLVKEVVYADVRRGIVRYAPLPLRLDKYKKRVIHRTLRGNVMVYFRGHPDVRNDQVVGQA